MNQRFYIWFNLKNCYLFEICSLLFGAYHLVLSGPSGVANNTSKIILRKPFIKTIV